MTTGTGELSPARLPLPSRIARLALDLVFPPHCVSCGALGEFICELCAAGMQRAEGDRCPVCWVGGSSGRCARCRYSRPAFKAARAVFVYDKETLSSYKHDGAVRTAVHALKYRDLSALGRTMAYPMAEFLAEWAPPVEVIVPVPLFGMRRRIRGYNQSELLAREVGRLRGLPVDAGAIVRRRATPPQVRQMGLDERLGNIAGAFAPGHRRLSGRSVLLIDDVMTTGATLGECARVLVEGGSGPVFALTFARED
jgi:ComF family protein